MSTNESRNASAEEKTGDGALEELIDEYADVVSELAGRDSPFADRLRQIRDGGEQ